MGKILNIHGSGTYLKKKEKWVNVNITEVKEGESVPLEIIEALIGLKVNKTFSKEQIESQTGLNFPIPNGSRLAYNLDVIKVLNESGKKAEASKLEKIKNNPLDMYVLEREIYQLQI